MKLTREMMSKRLLRHIRKHHNGNQSAFARSLDLSRSEVNRIVNARAGTPHRSILTIMGWSKVSYIEG